MPVIDRSLRKREREREREPGGGNDWEKLVRREILHSIEIVKHYSIHTKSDLCYSAA